MEEARIHYEVYVRRRPGAGWTLDMATEDRGLAVDAAGALMADGCAAAKVCKETLDPETREFSTVTIHSLGAVETARKAKPKHDPEPLCVTPQDLYTIHARERIGRLLDPWLKRHGVTPFELLHRPDLVEILEGSGIELQHAMQKIAIPEAEARDASVHEMIRFFLDLVERAIKRLMADARKGRLPDITLDTFGALATRLSRDGEGGYLLGAGVAGYLATANGWGDKVERLLDLADAAPADGPGRALALSVIEQPLSEILGSKSGFREMLGDELDLGGLVAAMTRLAAPKIVSALMAAEASVSKMMPELGPAADRLALWLEAEAFAGSRAALAKRIIEDLNGLRRLRPADPAGEIAILRALAMALIAASGPMLPAEDLQAAFSTRSKTLVTGEFVEEYLGSCDTARDELTALVWLAENVIGGANKRLAAQWLRKSAGSLRLEKELRQSADPPTARLAALANLQRAVGRCGLEKEDYAPIQVVLGQLGGQIEADAHLAASIVRAKAPVHHRLGLLLRLAIGETAPLGPATDRAKAEAVKLVRAEDTRQELSKTPQLMEAMRSLIQQAGLAA